MAKKKSLLEEQVAYLLEEETEVDNNPGTSGENHKYTASLKSLQESKKRLLKAQDEMGDEDLSEEDESINGKIKNAVGAIDDAMAALKQEMDGDSDEDENEDEELEEGKKKKLQQNQKGKKKLHQNEDESGENDEEDPEFVNEENDDEDEDEDEKLEENKKKGSKKK